MFSETRTETVIHWLSLTTGYGETVLVNLNDIVEIAALAKGPTDATEPPWTVILYRNGHTRVVRESPARIAEIAQKVT